MSLERKLWEHMAPAENGPKAFETMATSGPAKILSIQLTLCQHCKIGWLLAP